MHTSNFHACLKCKDALIAICRLTNICPSMHSITQKCKFPGTSAVLQPTMALIKMEISLIMQIAMQMAGHYHWINCLSSLTLV